MYRKNRFLLAVGFTFMVSLVNGQIGGNYVFGFLNLPTGARMASLANYTNAVADRSVDFATVNPALAHESMVGMYSIQQGLLPSGINYGSLCTALPVHQGILVPFIRYASYGKFQGYDALGNPTNSFGAFDFIAGASYSHPLNPRFSLGVNAGVVGSYLESYASYGVLGNFAIQYHAKNELLQATLLAKNAGLQFKGYTQGQALKPLPLEIQAALSVKLKHAPFRLTFITHHLNQWKIGYYDPSILPKIDGLTGDTVQPPTVGFLEQLGRHFAVNAELITQGVVQFRLGFDYQRRQELKLDKRPGMAGLSVGLGLNFRKFRIDYGLMIFSRAGTTNSLGISSKLSDWKKSKR